MASTDTDVWPSPVFEGSEKRLEVDFTPSSHSGLRSISRQQLDQLMTEAGCCIVSDRHNDKFDAYVLSESSLFVFPHKLVLKTCGTTKILHAIPMLLELAASKGCSLKRCKYSRASFLYPRFQVCLHKQRVVHTGQPLYKEAHLLAYSCTPFLMFPCMAHISKLTSYCLPSTPALQCLYF